jgi:hypothetical protein
MTKEVQAEEAQNENLTEEIALGNTPGNVQIIQSLPLWCTGFIEMIEMTLLNG